MLKIEGIEKYLRSKLPIELLRNFFESNRNRIINYNNEIKIKLINKFNKTKWYQNNSYNNFFNMDKSKWIINNCSKAIPGYVTNTLSLGKRFGLST